MSDNDIDQEWYNYYQDAPCRAKLAALGSETFRYLTTIDGYSQLLSKYYRGELNKELSSEQLSDMVDKIREAVAELKKLQYLMRTDFGTGNSDLSKQK
jgi:hypothetical protein